MIKSKIFRVLFFLFLVMGVPFAAWSNNYTEKYGNELVDSAIKTYSQKNYMNFVKIAHLSKMIS